MVRAKKIPFISSFMLCPMKICKFVALTLVNLCNNDVCGCIGDGLDEEDEDEEPSEDDDDDEGGEGGDKDKKSGRAKKAGMSVSDIFLPF